MVLGRGRRVVRRRAAVGTAVGVAATASMVSGARRNRAERQAIEQQNQAQTSGPEEQQLQDAPNDALTQQLEELNDLKERNLITQEELDAKRKKLLGL